MFQPCCSIEDLDQTRRRTTLATHGFESMRLPDRRGLLDRLRLISERSHFDEEDVQAVRNALAGARLHSADGSRLLVIHVVNEGAILRCVGPNGIELDGHDVQDQHGGASNVHADQDVLGRPLHQMTRGRGRRLFSHESPDCANRRSPLLLVNLWMPLNQVTRPLAMMDTRSLDRTRDQLRYVLPTESILDRKGEKAMIDIWWFRHDPAQRWQFRSTTGLGDAWVFDTLSTPHCSFVVPGEEVAAEGFEMVDAAVDAVLAGESVRPGSALRSGRAGTVALQDAIDDLQSVLDHGRRLRPGDPHDRWVERARQAQHAVMRMSVEVRALALRIPPRPFQRGGPSTEDTAATAISTTAILRSW